MSGSLTVIGGHSNTVAFGGLVTVPIDQTSISLSSLLQNELTSISGAVSVGSASLYNNNVIAGTVASSIGTDPTAGVYELTNTDSSGAVSPGSISGAAYTVPSGYNTLVVQAPGVESVTGNGTTNFLAIFSAQSTVSFFATGNNNGASGTGTVVASANNFIDVGGTYASGQGWSVIGGASGGDTINTTAENTAITTAGSGNVVGLAGVFSTVVAGGTGDLIGGIGGQNIVSLTGANSNVVIAGGSDTVYAAAAGETAFFAGTGGLMDFINDSGTSATVNGTAAGHTGGSLTVFGGAGGYYVGGAGGNNSLVGGTGTGGTTLIGAGGNNFESVQGSGSNALFAANPFDAASQSDSATLVAGAGTGTNILVASNGSDSLVSFGTGTQNFFAGSSGNDTLTGSTVSGAANNYFFDQTSLQGGGQDLITNFRFSSDNGYINPGDTAGGVSISGAANGSINGSPTATLSLTDGTTIKLLGVTLTDAQIASIVGGTHF